MMLLLLPRSFASGMCWPDTTPTLAPHRCAVRAGLTQH